MNEKISKRRIQIRELQKQEIEKKQTIKGTINLKKMLGHRLLITF